MSATRLLLTITIAAASVAALAQQTPAPLASGPTNWAGVTADVTEFKRKGNTLTAKLRLHIEGATDTVAEFSYDKSYLLDAAAGKKYEVLKDSDGHAIAAVNSGSTGWREHVRTGQGQIIWMKFPAPPATTKSITLNVDGIPPFDDLAIQDVP